MNSFAVQFQIVPLTAAPRASGIGAGEARLLHPALVALVPVVSAHVIVDPPAGAEKGALSSGRLSHHRRQAVRRRSQLTS